MRWATVSVPVYRYAYNLSMKYEIQGSHGGTDINLAFRAEMEDQGSMFL
jgi:hypothetical protein